MNRVKAMERKTFYASPVHIRDISLRVLAQQISEVCTVTPADCTAVFEGMLQRLVGDFGIFRLSFSTKGQDKTEDVSVSDIKNVRVLFLLSVELKRKLSATTFVRP